MDRAAGSIGVFAQPFSANVTKGAPKMPASHLRRAAAHRQAEIAAELSTRGTILD